MTDIIIKLEETELFLDEAVKQIEYNENWRNTIFSDYHKLSTNKQGLIGQTIIKDLCNAYRYNIQPRTESTLKRKTDCDLIIEDKTVEIKMSLTYNKVRLEFNEHKEVDRYLYVKGYPPSYKCKFRNSFKTHDGCTIVVFWFNKEDITHFLNEGLFKKVVGNRIMCNSTESYELLNNHILARPIWEWNTCKKDEYKGFYRPVYKDISTFFNI